MNYDTFDLFIRSILTYTMIQGIDTILQEFLSVQVTLDSIHLKFLLKHIDIDENEENHFLTTVVGKSNTNK